MSRSASYSSGSTSARFKKLEGCRRSAFEMLDKPAMRPLPAHRYQIAKWREVKVNIDDRVDYEHRLDSVPYTMVGAEVEIRATATSIEILHKSERVASHVRSYGPKGTYPSCGARRDEGPKRQQTRDA
ncbi:Mu transposase domain-containing protein [Pendulispora albinea]